MHFANHDPDTSACQRQSSQDGRQQICHQVSIGFSHKLCCTDKVHDAQLMICIAQPQSWNKAGQVPDAKTSGQSGLARTHFTDPWWPLNTPRQPALPVSHSPKVWSPDAVSTRLSFCSSKLCNARMFKLQMFVRTVSQHCCVSDGARNAQNQTALDTKTTSHVQVTCMICPTGQHGDDRDKSAIMNTIMVTPMLMSCKGLARCTQGQ